jgi:hypothetical protein
MESSASITSMVSPEMMKLLRSKAVSAIAEDLVSVQPMDEAGKAFKELHDILAANPNSHLVISCKREQELQNGTEETSKTEGIST